MLPPFLKGKKRARQIFRPTIERISDRRPKPPMARRNGPTPYVTPQLSRESEEK